MFFFFYGFCLEVAGGFGLSAPKLRDSLRRRRRFLLLPKKSRDFWGPQDARLPLRRNR